MREYRDLTRHGSEPNKFDWRTDTIRILQMGFVGFLSAIGPQLLSDADKFSGWANIGITILGLVLTHGLIRFRRDNSYETWRRRNPWRKY